MRMSLVGIAACVTGCFSLAGVARAEAGERPPAMCAPDGEGARLAVELAFAELQRVHRGRIPGPNGQVVLEQRTERLLGRFVLFSRFVDDALGEAWDAAPERRSDWAGAVEGYLKRRYLDRLGSPLGARLEIVQVTHGCDEARVAARVLAPGGRRSTDVELRLLLERARAEGDEKAPDFGPGRWRAFDVAVDGASLLELWRGRFRRIYADGGVAAIEEHLRNLTHKKAGRDSEP